MPLPALFPSFHSPYCYYYCYVFFFSLTLLKERLRTTEKGLP